MPNFHRPRPPLDAFVECFWYFPSYSVEHDRERALPTGTTEVVLNLGREPMRIFRDHQDLVGHHFDRSVVCGPHSRYFVLDTSKSGPVVGIHFDQVEQLHSLPARLMNCRIAMSLWKISGVPGRAKCGTGCLCKRHLRVTCSGCSRICCGVALENRICCIPPLLMQFEN